MTTQPRHYMAYLVRLWQVNGEGQPAWRASIEDPHTGEQRGFASLENLVAFLREQMEETSSRIAPRDSDNSSRS